MVLAMVCGPPEWSAMGGTGAHQREGKLSDPGSAECPVGEVAMIESRDREHPDYVKTNRDQDRSPRPSNPNNAQADEVNSNERDDAKPVDDVAFARCRRVLLSGGSVEPEAQSSEDAARQAWLRTPSETLRAQPLTRWSSYSRRAFVARWMSTACVPSSV